MPIYWHTQFTPSAKKEFAKLDHTKQTQIISFLENKIMKNKLLSVYGKPLKETKAGIWSFRYGNYRVLGHAEENILFILKVSHRKDMYR